MTNNANTPAVFIRPANDTDYAAVERLLVANDLPTDGVKDTLCGFLVAESGTDIVGVVGMEYRGEYGLLRSTAVDAAWRGRHVGRQLVERMVAEAESRGLKALYLLTTTAERYFPSFGFTTASRESVPTPIQETGEFRGACPAAATVMTLCLQPAAPR